MELQKLWSNKRNREILFISLTLLFVAYLIYHESQINFDYDNCIATEGIVRKKEKYSRRGYDYQVFYFYMVNNKQMRGSTTLGDNIFLYETMEVGDTIYVCYLPEHPGRTIIIETYDPEDLELD